MKTGQNERIRKGDHKKVVFDVELDEIEDLTKVDKIYWYLCTSYTDNKTLQADNPIIEKEKEDMKVEQESIEFDLYSGETSIDTGRYYHELRIKDDLDNISTLARGRITIY